MIKSEKKIIKEGPGIRHVNPNDLIHPLTINTQIKNPPLVWFSHCKNLKNEKAESSTDKTANAGTQLFSETLDLWFFTPLVSFVFCLFREKNSLEMYRIECFSQGFILSSRCPSRMSWFFFIFCFLLAIFADRMDRYQKVEKPKAETAINENELRITAQGRMRNYISYALSLLQVFVFVHTWLGFLLSV